MQLERAAVEAEGEGESVIVLWRAQYDAVSPNGEPELVTQGSGSVSMGNKEIQVFLCCFPLPQLWKKFLFSVIAFLLGARPGWH